MGVGDQGGLTRFVSRALRGLSGYAYGGTVDELATIGRNRDMPAMRGVWLGLANCGFLVHGSSS